MYSVLGLQLSIFSVFSPSNLDRSIKTQSRNHTSDHCRAIVCTFKSHKQIRTMRQRNSNEIDTIKAGTLFDNNLGLWSAHCPRIERPKLRPFGPGNSINQPIVIDSVVQWLLRGPLSIWVCAQLTANALREIGGTLLAFLLEVCLKVWENRWTSLKSYCTYFPTLIKSKVYQAFCQTQLPIPDATTPEDTTTGDEHHLSRQIKLQTTHREIASPKIPTPILFSKRWQLVAVENFCFRGWWWRQIGLKTLLKYLHSRKS